MQQPDVAPVPTNNKSNNNSSAPNKEPSFASLPEYYEHYYNKLLNETPEVERARIKRDLLKTDAVYPHVANFLRLVCAKAEGAYDGMVKSKEQAAP